MAGITKRIKALKSRAAKKGKSVGRSKAALVKFAKNVSRRKSTGGSGG